MFGQERTYHNKSGVAFTAVVKTLLNNYGKDDYEARVSKDLVGMELLQGYRIDKVIGAGNVGTTLLAFDQ